MDVVTRTQRALFIFVFVLIIQAYDSKDWLIIQEGMVNIQEIESGLLNVIYNT